MREERELPEIVIEYDGAWKAVSRPWIGYSIYRYSYISPLVVQEVSAEVTVATLILPSHIHQKCYV